MNIMNFLPGELVEFDILDKQYTKEGLATSGALFRDGNELYVYSRINLEDFPSFNDFIGKGTIVKHGEVGIILRYVGRPYKVSQEEKYNHYDVYELMIGDKFKGQVFKYNLKKINLPH